MIHPHKPFGSDTWSVVDERSSSGLARRLKILIEDAGSTPDEAWRLVEFIREHPDDWQERIERGERP